MTEPIRVAWIALSRQVGGAERQMLALAERLPRDRFAPELIVGAEVPLLVDRAAVSRIPVRSIEPAGAAADAVPDTGVVDAFRSRVAKAGRLVRICRIARYDVIDAWLYPADIAAALARPIIRSPIVFSGRRNIDPHGRFGRLEPQVEAAANRWTDTVVANSQAAADHAVRTQRVRPEQVRIIRNGVELPEPIAAEERAARRRALGASDAEVVIGSVASYTPVKRLDVLVAAFALVAGEFPTARLELVGEGPGRAALEAQVRALGLEERVCLHGFEVAPERLYPAFDIVALSSEREGLPNSLLEAAAAGNAIVSTPAGGASEIVVDGETGLLVPVGDVTALGGALVRLAGDPELARRLGAGARQHVEQRFGMDRFVAEFAALYEERVAARRRRDRPIRSPAA